MVCAELSKRRVYQIRVDSLAPLWMPRVPGTSPRATAGAVRPRLVSWAGDDVDPLGRGHGRHRQTAWVNTMYVTWWWVGVFRKRSSPPRHGVGTGCFEVSDVRRMPWSISYDTVEDGIAFAYDLAMIEAVSETLHSHQPLWRYMKLSTFLLLMQGKAWLPSVAALRSGEPLEGMLAKGLGPELLGELKKSGDSEELYEWLLNTMPNHMRKFMDTNTDDPQLRTTLIAQQFTESITRRRLAWCWFSSDLESAAMWSIYGGQGVAVKTDSESLEDALPSGKQFRIDPMGYVDRRQSAPNRLRAILSRRSDLMLRPHLLKAIEYEHEKEVRVTAFCPEDVNGLMITGIDSQKLIKQVNISPLFPADEAEAIKEAVNTFKSGFGDRITQSSLTGAAAGSRVAGRIAEALLGQTDENLRLTDLPDALQDL